MSFSNKDNHWLSISDLMSGLMLVFLMIAVIYMNQIQGYIKDIEKKDKIIKGITKSYEDTKQSLYDDLQNEFKNDFVKWNAFLDKDTLSIKFLPRNKVESLGNTDVFFERGSSEITQEYKDILDNFFPRYLKVLTADKYKKEIEEIRIEGHTSSEWTSRSSAMHSYFKNMELSQARTRNVLEYLMKKKYSQRYSNWLMSNLTANGLSYSKRQVVNDIEDYNASRRVEFRVRMNIEKIGRAHV